MSGGRGQDHQTTAAEDQAAAEAAAKAKAEAEAKAKAEAEAAAWDAKLGSSYNNALAEAQKYFSDRGLDPSQYLTDIRTAAMKARGVIPTNAANPDMFFEGIGADVFDNAQDLKRNEFLRAFSNFAPANFEQRSIADTADDPILNSIDAEQRGTAESYLENLVKRGVINDSGLAAARRNLDEQGYRAKSKLAELGGSALQEGRTKINNIANSGRAAASNFNLGENFDPYQYSTDINNALQGFFDNLGSNIRGRIPGSLYSTAGLPGVAGASMGAQNFKFDPKALAGITSEDDPEDEQNSLSAF